MTTTPDLGPCREFQGARTSKGYGAVHFGPAKEGTDGRRRRDHTLVALHRWVVEQVEGRPLETGEVVMHLCDNPPCFLYAHLRRASQTDNVRDAMAKGRQTAGESHPKAKLTWEQVCTIRARHAAGASARGLAREYGVTSRTVDQIIHGEIWKVREGGVR